MLEQDLKCYKAFLDAKLEEYRQRYDETVAEFGEECPNADILDGVVMGLRMAKDELDRVEHVLYI